MPQNVLLSFQSNTDYATCALRIFCKQGRACMIKHIVLNPTILRGFLTKATARSIVFASADMHFQWSDDLDLALNNGFRCSLGVLR